MKSKKRKIKKKYLILGLILITILYILLVKYYDVEGIGPDNSKIGFALLNYKFHELTGYNARLYNLTEYLGVLPFILVAYYGIVGLIKNPSTTNTSIESNNSIAIKGINTVSVSASTTEVSIIGPQFSGVIVENAASGFSFDL